MGKVNACLKRGYIIVASSIGTISALLLAATLFGHGYLHEAEEVDEMLPGIGLLYAVCILTLLLCIIGVYGASKEKQWALIVVIAGMSLVSLTMFVEVTRAIPARNETGEEVRREYQSLVPLSDAAEADKVILYNMQISLKCCGLEQGHQDWDYDIPESCVCTNHATALCVEAPKNSSLYADSIHDEPIMIYKEPCLPIFTSHLHMGIIIIIGIIFGLTLMWTLSAGLCAVMLYQVRRKFDGPPVVYSPEAKAGNYTTLAESAENA